MQRNKEKFFERFSKRLYPYDHMVLIYCWVIIVLTINFARPIGNFTVVLAYHFGVIIFVSLLAYFAHNSENRIVVFFRLLYPVLLMTFFYTTSGQLVHIIFPKFLDYQIVALEKSFFGVSPTLWLDQHLNVVVTEILSGTYFSYYFLIPGLSLFLFFGKRDAEIKRFLTATCATFFISYLLFIFYPVEGPRHFLASQYENIVSGPFFRKLVNLVIDNAAFHGGAMPSSHCGESIVVLFFAIRYYGKKAWFLIPIVIGLSMGTVYGRFHYVSDVVVGAGISVVAIWLTMYFYPLKDEIEKKARKRPKQLSSG